MLVIARNSTFVYKGKAVKVNQVAEELGVRYVLEGSIQKSGENLRVTAQLIDAIKGYHLWSERYDRDTKNFFTVQDDVTRNIVIALQVELTEGEQARIVHDTENLEAWGYVTKAYAFLQLYTKEKNAKARELFKQAAELDPNYAIAWVGIAWTHFIDSRYGFSESRSESFKRSVEFTQKAAKIDDSLPEVHTSWMLIYMLQRQHDKSIAEGKQAVALGPSGATSHFLLALTLHFAGRFEESIFHIKEAMRLDPYYPTSYLSVIGDSYCMAGEHEKAIAALEEVIERAKVEGGQRVNNHTRLIQALVELGNLEDAKDQAAEVLKLDPNFSLKNWQKSLFYKDPADLDRHLNALRKAGLPE
jgi:tetratricopeptide (TPR) repeat protein